MKLKETLSSVFSIIARFERDSAQPPNEPLMTMPAETMPTKLGSTRRGEEPALYALLLAFWLAFAFAVAATEFLNPGTFYSQDPDSVMRLVQVRDLLAGQSWFDLVQHRLAPPEGVLMHWSRLIDAPFAGLVLIGDLFGHGEAFALVAWPLLLLLGMMASSMYVATALGGRPAALPALILTLFFFSPLLSFLPGSIDHHNAQLVLMMVSLACVMRLRAKPAFGFAAGFLCATMMAIGLEMLPYLAVFGAVVALQWAMRGEGARGTAWFGVAFAVGPAALYFLTGSPEAALACDSLSYAYVVPAVVAGLGLAACALLVGPERGGTARLACLVGLGAATVAAFLIVAPECRNGPYGFLSPELTALWLNSVTEAQPIHVFSKYEPVGIIALITPPAVALLISLRRAWAGRAAGGFVWAWPAVLIAAALAMSFYQVRTLPYANAVAIPVLGAWMAELAQQYGVASLRPFRRVLPLVLAFLVAMPLVHLALGWAAKEALSFATAGRIAPIERPDTPKDAIAGLSDLERDCVDPSSVALFASVPAGLVLSPVFYGSSVLAISDHSVVAAPYHRAGDAIVDAIRATDLPPDRALAILRARNVDYLAICTTIRETALTAAEAPKGLLATLLAGSSVAGLEPVPASTDTRLRLWRVRG